MSAAASGPSPGLPPGPPPGIVILTGAGVSAESGLSTFRDPDGIWQRVRIEDVATPEAFARDPARVHAFYNARRAQLPDAQPNAAHHALARLEREWPGAFLLVTQNVDDLHDRAGSRPLHMHGELRRVRCLACGARHGWEADLSTATPCPACAAAQLRPDIVWFGEMPMGMDRIGAGRVRAVRVGRHVRQRLSRRRLRAGGGARAYGRAEFGAVRRVLAVPGGASWPGNGGRARLRGAAAGRVDPRQWRWSLTVHRVSSLRAARGAAIQGPPGSADRPGGPWIAASLRFSR